MKKLFLLTGVILICALASASAAGEISRVKVGTKNVVERDFVAGLGADILGVNPADGSLSAFASPAQIGRIVRAGLTVTPDEQKDLPIGMDAYHDEAELLNAINGFAEDFPDLVSLFSIGRTYEDRDIWCLKISDNAATDETDEPGIMITGETHAREYVTLEETLDFASRLLTGYGTDDYATYLVDNREIFIIPRVNPDGNTWDIEHFDDMAGPFYWRKNRAPNANPDCPGTDINRNYEVGFGGGGSSDDPCSEVYHGSAALSEQESQAIRDFLLGRENITTAIDLHSFAGLILYPWGYQHDLIPEPDLSIHQNAANFIALKTGYVPEASASLYINAGSSLDYEYGVLGLTALTIEIDGDDFYPAYTTLNTVFDKMWSALTFAAGIAEDPSMVLTAGLWRLEATADGTDVDVHWSSICDLLLWKYNVARSDSETGTYTVVNDDPIATMQSDYHYIDGTDSPHTTFWYKILYTKDEETVEFGPVSVTTGEMSDDTADDTADDSADDTSADDTSADDSATDDASDDAADDTESYLPDDMDEGSTSRSENDEGDSCGC